MEKYEIQKLRDLPIEEVAERLGMQVARHKCLCPFHDDHHASFTFNTRKNYCRCYVCMDHSIGTIDLVMKYTGKDFRSACRWLADAHNVYIEERKRYQGYGEHSRDGYAQHSRDGNTQHSRDGNAQQSRDGNAQQSGGNAPSFEASKYARFFEHPWLNEAARRFLFTERRIDARVVSWCRLTSWTDKEGISWLQIPYFDTEGKLIGIQNRNLNRGKQQSDKSSLPPDKKTPGKNSLPPDKEAPRFRFPYGSQCGIYNLPIIRLLSKGEPLYITEGCSDCWAMLSAGHKAIAIPSATLLRDNDKQWLADISERMRIQWHMYPDKDAPGERLFMQLKEILPSLEHHQLPPGCKDFSDYFVKENSSFARTEVKGVKEVITPCGR